MTARAGDRGADRRTPTVLVTGFEPFGGSTTNPSWDAVEVLAARWDGPARLVTLRLPCTFAEAPRFLADAVTRHAPDLVVCTGLAAGRTGLSLERVAVNVVDARIPDNAGAQPVDVPVEEGAPVGRLTTLPIKAVLLALTGAGVPAAVSNSAGTFVCNQVFFSLMGLLEGSTSRGGFVHVPSAAADDAATGMTAEDVARGLDVLLRTALTVTEDVAVAAGAEH